MIDQASASVDAWSRYWRSAQLAACMGGEDGNYAGVVRAAWEQFFRQVDSGSIIVDLATGNGAIALIAAAVSDQYGKELEVHGVDLADLAPEIAAKEQLELLNKIHFHPNTSIESMPFSDRSVAMISSQYGIEYSNTMAVLKESARILKPNGRMMVITHSKDSSVMKQTNIDLQDSHLVSIKLDIVSKYKTLITEEMVSQATTSQQGRDHAQSEFQQATAEIAFRMRARDEKTIEFLNGVMHRFGEIYQQRHQGDVAAAHRLADDITLELDAHRRRLQDLKQAALSPDDLTQWKSRAKKLGLTTVADEPVFNERGGKLGHRLEFVMNGR
jgi:ubiquinone/menaquinone biosynthesis C-methylase UbiE